MTSPAKCYPIAPTLIEFTGRDRLKWLHSFVTNEIRQLTTAQWCETFATDAKGKSLSHGCVFRSDERVYFLSMQAGQAAELLPHWDRYIISEDVTPRDASSEYDWFYVNAKAGHALLDQAGFETEDAPPSDLQTQANSTASAGQHVAWWMSRSTSQHGIVVRGYALPNEYALIGLPAPWLNQWSPLVTMTDPAETRALAARNYFPWFGIDFSKDNLPQEVDRDAVAISFKKGCYLGQETIARLDALGQVQKKLFAVSLEGSQPVSLPAPLYCGVNAAGEKNVAGNLTSAYALDGQTDQVGFATLRRKFFETTDAITLDDGRLIHKRSRSI